MNRTYCKDSRKESVRETRGKGTVRWGFQIQFQNKGLPEINILASNRFRIELREITGFSLPHLYIFSLKCWENVLFELRSERTNLVIFPERLPVRDCEQGDTNLEKKCTRDEFVSEGRPTNKRTSK